MKVKFLFVFLLLATGIIVENQAQTPDGAHPKKILTVYYSHSGNTQAVAEQIHKTMGGDIFEIVMEKPYPDDYNEVIDITRKEMKENYRPAITGKVSGMESYDVIFVGTPIWFSTAALPVFSFLESYDFSGKTIIPFFTCGGGTEGTTAADMQKICPNATFLPIFGLSKSDREAGTGTQKIEEHLKQLKF